MSVCVWLNPIHLSDTHTHAHATTQLTIILMPICLIVGFLIPRAASSFQQGLTVLALDGLSLCARVCEFPCACVMLAFSWHPVVESSLFSIAFLL